MVIVHTAKLPGGLPQPFIDILKDPQIAKIGANPGPDVKRIQKFFQAEVFPVVDVLKEAKTKVPFTATGRWGLADVCDTVLGKKMFKDDSVRMSFKNDASEVRTFGSTQAVQYMIAFFWYDVFGLNL